MFQTNSAFLTDSYKLAHHDQYPEGTSLVFSNFTPRTNKYASEATKFLDSVLVFGVQLGLMKIRDHFNQNFFFTKERSDIANNAWGAPELARLKAKAINPIKEEIELFLGMEYDTTHFEKLWDLGYLPLEIRALDEGTLCPIKVPMLTIHNTHPDFFWLPNFLETILSQMLWKPMTSATIALSYRKTMEKWAEKTNPEGKEFVLWQGHDFSMRGLDAVEATQASGLGHLSVFYGTDSLPTLSAARYYYGAKGFIAGSVPATEHSVMSAGSKEGEIETFRRLMKNQPKGILSVVSDTWDLWKVLTVYLPELKDEIMARDGKLVIRPDSGDPVDILCGHRISYDTSYDDYVRYKNGKDNPLFNENEFKGVIEILWDVFGGTINEQGYKVLDPHIGAIYGDSITNERCEEICKRLEAKGFASTNIVFGIGSYTYQFNTRDNFGFAMKATYVEREDSSHRISTNEDGSYEQQTEVTGYEIFKDPVTDTGMKKSARGLLRVVGFKNSKGSVDLVLHDQCTWDDVNSSQNQLKLVFKDGELLNPVTLEEIRNRVNKLV